MKKYSVKVYSTPICPYCVVLKKFLGEHNIEFEDVDMSQNEEAAKEIIEKSGQMRVPVIEINGEIVVGFDKEKISTLLNIK
ncbi:NrdH-redoxin [bacterium (Candidatus Gribaldobacteria) CG_4_9_14_3_um_filter_33_9]|nr:MAG: NrdH-redoxin [bacterium (Candidatus Gribaldobacteria) CG_4_9_14_3_um_filter_33_9]